MAVSDTQRTGLWRAKLRTLARHHFGRTDGTDHEVPWGAALETEGAWTALIEVSPERSFGQALALAARHGATSLDLLIAGDGSTVARRAALFDPSPTVWRVTGTQLEPAAPSDVTMLVAADLEPEIAALLSLDDLDVIIEHGAIMGECRGLEVARVTGAGAEQRLDVGVGAYDQGAFAVINADMAPNEALAEVLSQVLMHRRRDALTHPINRMARERWVRSELLLDPSLVGLVELAVIEPVIARHGIRDVAIAAALGRDADRRSVLVACTVGIDLDAVPAAADLAARHDADRIMIVLPDRDRHALVQSVAAQSRRPVEFVTAPEPWPRAAD